MKATPGQHQQNDNEETLLRIFDELYARTAERSFYTAVPNAQKQDNETLLALLPLLIDSVNAKSKEDNTETLGQSVLTQAQLLVGPEGTIKSFSISIPSLLRYPTILLAERPFSALLTETSANNWEGVLAVAQGRSSFHTATALTLLTLHRHPVPALCSVYKLLNSNQLQVSLLFSWSHLPPETATTFQHNSARNDAVRMQQLHDLILQHLDRPLPTIQQLARTLGTNTFALKEGFKHYFNTGIHQFYTQERLAKAKLLLLETDLPLAVIAEQCGYGSPSHFSKAFKKKYGIAPLPFKKTKTSS
ncbi:helix-turn-helix transcriptional regulator [Flavobacterium sp. PLA-1-15]|uniref:helix-turn-helix transcriptional regulator n=1 Tax=Flavobacterium sp. PLA-1-15 TaxID=3380533 RepID=UPI003B78290D